MSVITYEFLAFLVIALIIYYLVPKSWQWGVLLAGSLVFYAYSGVKYLIFVVGTAVLVYVMAILMQKNLDQQNEMLKDADRKTGRKIKAEMRLKRKAPMAAGVVFVILILAVFKGTTFAIKNFNHVLQIMGKEPVSVIRLAAPLGISYYSFMMISYLVDLYRGRINAEKNFLKYLTYVLYFPHITQGPIARYEEVAGKMFMPHPFDYDQVVKGSWLMLWGFFKKLMIADHMAVFVNEVFKHQTNYQGPIFLLAGIIYSIQIYCDFSGCMDIVRGVSECFGIELQENFLRPYFSQTLPEFWRRWHATLGTFFREYVFYPVSTSGIFLKLNTAVRKIFGNTLGGNLASCVPILCVWVLTGVWHGATWNYIGWGLFHGVMICLSTIFDQPLAKLTAKLKIKTQSRFWILFRMLRTFFLCVIGRIIFMGKGIHGSIRMLVSVIVDYKVTYPMLETFKVTRNGWILIGICCIVLLCVSIVQEMLSKKEQSITIRDWLAQRNIIVRWTILLGGIMLILCFGVYGSGIGQTFIYEQF